MTLLWKKENQATLLSFSNYHIDIATKEFGMGDWRFTGFYGEPNRNNRRKTWDLLRNLSRDGNLPWCVMGDLNNIVSQSDKRGGAPYPRWLIDGFNEALVDAELIDMNIIGHQFTWERSRGSENWIETRLDRVLTNERWTNLFSRSKLYNLEGSPSDHSPIFLDTRTNFRELRSRRNFKFENAWLAEPLCFQLVKDSWEGDGSVNICEKVLQCSHTLEAWGREITSNFGGRIKECKAVLKQLRSRTDAESLEKFKATKQKLFLILDQKKNVLASTLEATLAPSWG